jgi:hypothetical protein
MPYLSLLMQALLLSNPKKQWGKSERCQTKWSEVNKDHLLALNELVFNNIWTLK